MEPFDSKRYLRSVSLKLEKIEDFNRYPFSLAAVKGLSTELELHESVTFLVGENGSGKSTLLEALAVSQGFNPEGGTQNFNFATQESHSCLNQFLRVVKGIRRPKTGFFLRAESFYNVATEIDRIGVTEFYGGISLHEQSHGESFFALMQNRLAGKGCIFLMSPRRRFPPIDKWQ